MLSTLRQRVDGLEELERGVTEEQLEHRVAATNDALAMLRQRLDALAETHTMHSGRNAPRSTASARSPLEETREERAVSRDLADGATETRVDGCALARARPLGKGGRPDSSALPAGEALAGVSHRLEAIAGEARADAGSQRGALDRRFTETEDKLTELARRLDGSPPSTSMHSIAASKRRTTRSRSWPASRHARPDGRVGRVESRREGARARVAPAALHRVEHPNRVHRRRHP